MYKAFFSLFVAGILATGLAVVRADDKPGHDQDHGKMSMADMMKSCKEHATACQKHIDEASTAADAGKNDETKKHLTMAKDEMAKCMKMMAMMEKMPGMQGGGSDNKSGQ